MVKFCPDYLTGIFILEHRNIIYPGDNMNKETGFVDILYLYPRLNSARTT